MCKRQLSLGADVLDDRSQRAEQGAAGQAGLERDALATRGRARGGSLGELAVRRSC